MDLQHCFISLCVFVHFMLISVACKVQNNSRKTSVYPIIVFNTVRSYMQGLNEKRSSKGVVLLLILLEIIFVSKIMKKMERYLDDECVAILFILFLMMTADVMYLNLIDATRVE